MALTVDEIAEILNTMREENETATHGIERVLTGLNNKIDIIADDNEATDLLRVYISELKKSVEEKHNDTFDKLIELETLFNNLSSSAKETAKISELRELFTNLETGVSSFSNEVLSQKNLLDSLSVRIEQLKDSSFNRDEISSLFQEVSVDISGINSYLDNSFKSVQDRITSVISVLNELDSSKEIIALKDDINTLNLKIEELPSSISQFYDIFNSLKDIILSSSNELSSGFVEEFQRLESSFESIVTGADFKSFKSDLADFVQKIIDNSTALNSELSYSTERIESILETVKSLDFRDDFENIVSKVNELHKSFEDGSRLNYTNLSKEISSLSDNFNKSFENLDSERQEFYASLKESLDNILVTLSGLAGLNTQAKLEDILQLIRNITDYVNQLRNGISSDIQSDYGDLKAGMGSVVTLLEAVKSDVISKNEENFAHSDETLIRLEEKIDTQIKDINSLKNAFEEKTNIEPSVITDILDKISGEISQAAASIQDNSNSNYEAVKTYVEEIISSVNNLNTQLIKLSEESSDKLRDDITGISADINELKTEFRESVQADLENTSKLLISVDEVLSKVSGVEETFSENSKNNFENLKLILENLSRKISDDIEEQKNIFNQINSDSDKEKIDFLNRLSSDVKDIQSVLSFNIDSFKYNVQENIQNIKDYIGELSTSLTSTQTDNDNKLTNKLESIEVLSHAFEASISSVHNEVVNITEQLSSFNFEEQNSNITNQFFNVISVLNTILSSVEEINKKNSELSDVILNINSVLESQEDTAKILDKLESIEKQDYSYDLEQLSSKIEDLSVLFETSSNNNYENLAEKLDLINKNIQDDNKADTIIEKIDDFSNMMFSLRGLIENLNSSGGEKLSQEFGKYEQMFAAVVTSEDFQSFRTDLSEFLQKILDNAGILQMNSETAREQISVIIEKLNAFDYSDDFENIAGRIDEIKESFENNSKMNYENIIQEIDSIKDLITRNFNNNINLANFEQINSAITDLSLKIQFLNDLSQKNSVEILQKISDEISLLNGEIETRLDGNTKSGFEDLKLYVTNIAAEISSIKDDFSKQNDANAFSISSGFDSVKLSLENILTTFNSLNGELLDASSKSADALLAEVKDAGIKVDDLKFELQHISSAYLERVFDVVKTIDEKIELLSDGFSGNVTDNINSLKEMISALSENFKEINEDFYRKLNDDNLSQNVELQNISNNISDLKSHISDTIEGLKVYVTELDSVSNELKSGNINTISEKLLNIEASIVQSSEDYEQRMETLQGKLSEFVQIVENSTSDTEAKIASSLDEITEVKSELVSLSDVLKSSKITADEKFTETISVIDKGIENIIDEINSSFSSLSDNSVKENLSVIEDKLTILLNDVENLKNNDTSANLEKVSDTLSEKILSLKQEFELVNTDITDAFQCKAEEIIRAFEPVKNGIEEFSTYNFEKVLAELKSQIQDSFESFTMDVNGELGLSSESIERLQQAYKELFNKISSIEESVCNSIQSDIELLSSAFEKNMPVLKNSIDEKLQEGLDDLKAYLDVISNKSTDNNALHDVLLRLDSLNDNQNTLIQQGNLLSAGISKIDKDLQEKTKASVDALHEKFDILADTTGNDEILSLIDELDLNAQQRETDIHNSIKNVADRIGSFDSSFNLLAEGVNKISDTGNKMSDVLSVLHEKIDVLALNENDSNIIEEIDDIKELIFEQRKFFEAASDEKGAAIDKYLRDVLLKLDNIDLEKNSEDLKETLMNALVSLFEQISFVEETEEIKDFVEEKTDEIKQNLIQVQTQLHQIASSNDDFDYSYTLQDVESDIAKLRLALNQISAGADFEGLSEGIKKIVNSVDGLESSLTHEQIVDLKSDIEKLNDDILSISSRTNKLLLTSDESYKALNDGLNNFSSLVYRLEDRINELDKTQISDRLERKLDSVHSMAVASANADKVFHQVMMYLGEWIDSTTENISSITDKTSEISIIKENINELKNIIPEKSQLLDELQSRFVKQEERIDNLEMKLDKILSTLEEKDDMVLNRKVDKIEKMLSRLGTNIEKLTSYVDEE